MKDNQKVYIRGVKGRGDEVVKMLEEYGENKFGLYGVRSAYLYFIDHEGNISAALIDSEVGKIIMDNYTELHLPEKWKPQIKEDYYHIDNDGDIMPDTWDGFIIDAARYNFGNVFRTREEAKAMAEKVKKLLKGE